MIRHQNIRSSKLLPRLVTLLLFLQIAASVRADVEPITVGWIGSMTGPQQKWAAYEAAQMAFEEVNKAGGIQGRPLKIVWEDGKGAGKSAAAAAQKLISVDRVRYILGGHCTPESLAIAPIAQRAGVIMVAAITSNPYLTTAGDNIFRVTAVSTNGPERIARHAESQGLSKFAVLYEESDYPRPQAEKFRDLILANGGTILSFQGIPSGETDFRSLLTALRMQQPHGIYLASLAPDFAILLLKQLSEMHLKSSFFGNENVGYAVRSAGNDAQLFEGMVFAASRCDEKAEKSRAFFDAFAQRYGGRAAPYGCYTAEAYDAVHLLASTISRCGDSADAVKKCLYETQNYSGASGTFSFDQNGDVLRDYDLLQVKGGKILPLGSNKS